MEESSLPTATFVLDENGLLQTGTEAILSETIIDQDLNTQHFSNTETVVSQQHSSNDDTVTIEHDGEHSIDISTSESPWVQHQEENSPSSLIKTKSFCATDKSVTRLGKGKFPITMVQTRALSAPIKLSTGSTAVSKSPNMKSKAVPYTLTRVNNGAPHQKASFKILRNNAFSSNAGSATSVKGHTANYSTHSNIASPEAITINIADAAEGISLAGDDTISANNSKSVCFNETGDSSSPQLPPPGCVSKLARNTTLIDLKKLKTETDHNTPFLIDQVTVMVDESDNVKVILKK